MDSLSGFATVDVDVDGVRVHARTAGSGPPVLLLHGYPQTHVMWHRVAPVLAKRHTVVLADLRGYGDSDRPADEPGGAAGDAAGSSTHAAYSKRAMAADQVGLMRALGHERFAVVGHDRGARVTHRLCLDHPEAVTRAAVLDVAPTRHVLHHVDLALARTYEHWFFLSQENDLPERLIGSDPGGYLRAKLDAWSAVPGAFDEAALAEYVRCFSDPAVVHASCEDYRAAVTVDLALDDADAAAGRRVEAPLLVLWGARGFVGAAYDVEAVWQEYAADVTARSLDCGHFLPEEAPEATTTALLEFLTP
ncbi:alpha/beta fold hydrolase [Nocardioides aurantiacus]|uniref:Haloacetate dehalogenase n=1 Tax=Nocardioides aurantiacus TaxID=86796 RepID=A0A3N2CQE1_9ACTN|nr:alpha/beta hydrolase [Nocardioides aurantiacus]ROR89743.1 haloacetate dehalogenase [Nocardioides aurantiacus]